VPPSTLAPGPTLAIDGQAVRLLAVVCDAGGGEVYEVAVGADARPGRLRHTGSGRWALRADELAADVSLGDPDDLFDRATGGARVRWSPPHWPPAVTDRLRRRGLAGAGVIALDAAWFLAQMPASPFDQPLCFPGGVAALGLGVPDHDGCPARVAAGGVAATLGVVLLRGSEGRLLGLLPTGEVAQLGVDLVDGCQVARGSGLREVAFDAGEPLGLGLGASARGVWIGEVEPGGAADRAGLRAGMVVVGVSGGVVQALDDALAAIDQAFFEGAGVVLRVDTASVATGMYAVEMAAALALRALGAAAAPDVGAALAARGGLLWRESTPRLFLGEAGSVTSAHVDLCPQVQVAQGLWGTKLLSVASHAETRRLVAAHGDDDDPTHLPTDRPLRAREAQLLGEPSLSVAALQAGDLVVFDSGALHVASHGVDGPHAAVYQGVMTPGGLPRLRRAAEAQGVRDAASQGRLMPRDLLRLLGEG
jgi:hypothetical protein